MDFEKTEQITPYLTRSWLDDGSIVIYSPKKSTRDNVDAWHDITLQTAETWGDDKPYLELHDMREAVLTPYSRAKASDLVRQLAKYHGRAAIVIAQTRLGDIIGFFVNNVFSIRKGSMERRVFTSIEDALQWLRDAKLAE